MLKFESSVEANARHLERAQREMLQVRRDPSNPHIAWVSSATRANHWHRVTRTSCSCPARGTCKHMAIAAHMADAGLIPFEHSGETVVSAKPSLRTQVQVGWACPAPRVEVIHTPAGYWFARGVDHHGDPRTAIFVGGEERFQVRGDDFNVAAYRCRFGRNCQPMAIVARRHADAVAEILDSIGVADPRAVVERAGIGSERNTLAS